MPYPTACGRVEIRGSRPNVLLRPIGILDRHLLMWLGRRSQLSSSTVVKPSRETVDLRRLPGKLLRSPPGEPASRVEVAFVVVSPSGSPKLPRAAQNHIVARRSTRSSQGAWPATIRPAPEDVQA